MTDRHLLRPCAILLFLFVLSGCISLDVATQKYATSINSQTATQTDSVPSNSSTLMNSVTDAMVPVSLGPSPPPEGKPSLTVAPIPPSITHTSSGTATEAPKPKFEWRQCATVLMVTGGLILICTVLLLTTLILLWKVCQLSRRLAALGSNDDLISNSEYWIGTAKKNKSKHKSEATETSMLMTGFTQTQEQKDNKSDKGEEGAATQDGQKKEDAVSGEDVLAVSPFKPDDPKEETTNNQVNNVAETSAECKEEAKGVL